MEFTLKLVKYRDAGLPTYTYFWVDSNFHVRSGYFNSEKEAQDWLDGIFKNATNNVVSIQQTAK